MLVAHKSLKKQTADLVQDLRSTHSGIRELSEAGLVFFSCGTVVI